MDNSLIRISELQANEEFNLAVVTAKIEIPNSVVGTTEL